MENLKFETLCNRIQISTVCSILHQMCTFVSKFAALLSNSYHHQHNLACSVVDDFSKSSQFLHLNLFLHVVKLELSVMKLVCLNKIIKIGTMLEEL